MQAVGRAAAENRSVRVVGAGHSHSPLVVTDDLLVDPTQLSGVVAIDAGAMRVKLRAGTRIADLGAPLREAGLALRNQGDIDRQAIAGALATGTHGTGPTLQNFCASLRGARVVLANGEIVSCSANEEPELFQAVRLSLGAVGLVTEVELAVRDAYRLHEHMWLKDLDEVLDEIDDLTRATRHFEFFWTPPHSRAACKALDVTDDEPIYPLADEGKRLAWSYDVLANDRPIKHTEMEYSVPAESGPACLRAVRDLVRRDFPDLAWPIEYRTVAADDVWLSTAFERPTVTISVHQGIELDDEPVFRACEEIFRSFEGRPHWGKVHYLSGDELAEIHPRWDDWWRVRDLADPEGRFLNPYLKSLRTRPHRSGT